MSTVNGAWRGPNIVKEGLQLYLDAGSPNSYYSPTATTTWKDISGYENNAILTNGAFYTGSDGGAMVFDGTDDYAAIANSSTINPNTGSFSIVCWVNSDPSAGGEGWDLWVAKRQGGSNGYYVGANNPSGVRFMLGNDGGSRTDTAFISYTFNTWAMFTAILDRSANTQTIIRNNFDQTASTTPSGGNYYNTGTLSVGADIGINAYYVNGKVGMTMLYGIALTNSQVTQIYNATKTRFGL